MFRYLMRKGR